MAQRKRRLYEIAARVTISSSYLTRENLKFWLPVTLGTLITPLFFFASSWSGSGAASHVGGGFQIFFFYPIPVGIAILLSGGTPATSVKIICIVIGALQFPFFGWVIGIARTNRVSILFTPLLKFVWVNAVIPMIALSLVGAAVFLNR